MHRLATRCLLLLMAASFASAAKPEFNVDFACGWGRCYRPMEWTPVQVNLSSNLTEPFGGSLILSGPQDAQNNLNIVHPFVLTPHTTLSLPLVTKMRFGIPKCNVTIRDERGRAWLDQAVDLWNTEKTNRMLQVVRDQDMLIGVTGQPLFNVLRLDQETVATSSRGSGKVFVGYKACRSLPWDWTGFASLDLLILYDPDWTQFRPEQIKAICDWVSNGGTLFLVLGVHPLPADSPIAPLLPFSVGQPRRTTVAETVWAQWALASSSAETVTVWPLAPKPNTVVVRMPEDSAELFGVGWAGFGRVAVLAFDPSQLSAGQVAGSASFWVNRITACLTERSASGQVSATGGYRRAIVLSQNATQEQDKTNEFLFQSGLSQDSINRVLEYQYNLKQMRPLSIGWVILILVSMALLLGPVDYFVLKRLDRLPLTWLTSLGWIVVFTVGAYYGVQALRGGQMQIRTVSVVDSIAGSPAGWATHYLGVFAPQSDEYQLDGLGAPQWWSGVTSSTGEVYVQQGGLMARQIYCQQMDGSNLPFSVPINIWTVQSLVGEMPASELRFQAAVEREGDRVLIEITNLSREPARAGFVLFQDGYADLPALLAGATQKLELPVHSFNPWQVQQVSPSGNPRPVHSGYNMQGVPAYPPSLSAVATGAFLAPACLSRTLAMHDYLRQGAALVGIEFHTTAAPFRVKDHAYDAASVQWARQIVLPKNAQKE